jgi:hypothetical protein
MRRNRQVNIDWGGDEALDGETVRTRMVLMDSMFGHRPGYAPVALADAMAAKRARQEMIDRASNAWRGDGRIRRREPDDEDRLNRERPSDRASREVADAAKTASYLAMVGRAENAWRMPTGGISENPPVRDAGDPDVMRGHLSGEPDREAMYEARKTSLSNAWRSPSGVASLKPVQLGAGPANMVEPGVTSPSVAARIENQREAWLGAK